MNIYELSEQTEFRDEINLDTINILQSYKHFVIFTGSFIMKQSIRELTTFISPTGYGTGIQHLVRCHIT